MDTRTILLHPFTLGLGLGLLFVVLALYRVIQLKLELTRFKRHLSDKLEIEAESARKFRADRESIRLENENLRIKIASLNEASDRKLIRDLEIFARAEKQMLISVPGFAPVWENARKGAVTEIEEEEKGKRPLKHIFTQWFGSSGKESKTLPDSEG